MHSGPANDCNHLANGRHARDFSLKVSTKPVIKTGVGVSGFAADIVGFPGARSGLNPKNGHHPSQQSDRFRR
jgi:hypothetical protein